MSVVASVAIVGGWFHWAEKPCAHQGLHLGLVNLSGQTIIIEATELTGEILGSRPCVLRSAAACPDSAAYAPQLSWASAQPGGLRVRLGFFNIAELGELLREPCRRAGMACRYRETDGWHEVVIARPSAQS